jgi:mxaJ protein
MMSDNGKQRVAALTYTAVTLSAVMLCVHVARARADAATPLKVCADPNNLPFSNEARDGFENKIATLVGGELHRPVEYTWWAQRRGFVRNTLNTGECDLVVGTASGMEMLSTTRPYYKSTYVFLSRKDRKLGVRSFDDSLLHHVKIGVQLIGDDFANTPPVHALANRGIVKNVVGFPVYGDYAQANPAARIVDAVAKDDVDLAVVWGPLAGYFAQRSPVPLEVVPVSPRLDLPYLPFVFDIAMGVRRGDSTFRKELDEIIVRRKPTIDSILTSYGVPLVDIRQPATLSEATDLGRGAGVSGGGPRSFAFASPRLGMTKQ